MLKLPINNIYSLLINLYTPNVHVFYSPTIFTKRGFFHSDKSKPPIYILTLHNSNYTYIIDITTCSILTFTEFYKDKYFVTIKVNEGINPSLTLLFLCISSSDNFINYNKTFDIIKSIDIPVSDTLMYDIKLLI